MAQRCPIFSDGATRQLIGIHNGSVACPVIGGGPTANSYCKLCLNGESQRVTQTTQLVTRLRESMPAFLHCKGGCYYSIRLSLINWTKRRCRLISKINKLLQQLDVHDCYCWTRTSRPRTFGSNYAVDGLQRPVLATRRLRYVSAPAGLRVTQSARP